MIHKHINRFKAGVYKITNLINNKIYIGSSINLYNRFHTHKTKLKKNIHVNKHLQASFNKYGEDNFLFEVLEECDNEELIIKEQYYLNILKPNYNTREIAQNNLGRVVKQEEKDKISNTLKEKNKKLIEQGLPSLNPLNKETWKAVVRYSLEGNKIDEFPSISEASRNLIGNLFIQPLIIRICNKKSGRYKEYQFRYKSDNLEKIEPYINNKNKEIIFENDDESLTFPSLKEAAKFFNLKHINARNLKTKKFRDYDIII